MTTAGAAGASRTQWISVPGGSVLFVVLGGVAIVAGGLVSAATAVAPTAHESWAAAYLVLVVGAALAVLGVAQAMLVGPLGRARRLVELGAWLAGSAGVLVGVLARSTAVVDGGSAVLLVALGCFGVAGWQTGCARAPWRWGYRALIVLLTLSVVSGALLARSMPG